MGIEMDCTGEPRADLHPEPPMTKMFRCYTEPHRHYHNLAHVAEMLHAYRDVVEAGAVAYDPAQVWAIWYHDLVYVPGAGDNEKRSAEHLILDMTDPGYDLDSVRRAERIVLDTATHEPSIQASAVVMDLDFLRLGLEPSLFDHHAEQLRREYVHSGERRYREGRARFLDALLARARIFATDYFAERYERQARENLARALGRYE